LAPNAALCRHVAALEKSTAARFKAAPGRGKVRRFGQFHDAQGHGGRAGMFADGHDRNRPCWPAQTLTVEGDFSGA
jgi:hypothetical protein